MAQTNNIPTSPSRRRPSISNPIAWLARTSSAYTHSHSQSHSHSHSSPPDITTAMRISEPQLVSDFYAPVDGSPCMHPRYGVLGSGATVVRTPKDALTRAASVPLPPVEPPDVADDDGSSSSYDEPEPSSPFSMPLPPLFVTSKSSPNLPGFGGRNTPSPTQGMALPLNVDPTPPQPPFTPVLLSPLPDLLVDPMSLIVTLETSTRSLRTTYNTLTSRPSHLTNYLYKIARDAREREKRKFRDTLVEVEEEFEESEDDGHRLSDPNSPFTSLFNAHLASAGLLPQSATHIQLFLDRSSAPYDHILAYLRSPVEHRILPRAVTHPDRLEDLLELRDEARYLGLEDLHRLCCDAIRRQQGHVRGASSNSSNKGQKTRGRVDVRPTAASRHQPSPSQSQGHARGSTDSEAVPSDLGHIQAPVPLSPSASVGSARGKSPAPARSLSRGPRSASDWI